MGLASGTARGIDLDFVLNSGADLPNYDPDASGMMSLFDFAESFYEDVFEDADFSVTIDVGYANMDVLGLYNPANITIRIDSQPSTGWFIDPTPADNSEFDMVQVFWRDITNTQKANWYNDYGTAGNIPDTFEVGFRSDDKLDGPFDMLTVVLHEVAHALGMNALTVAGTLDGDYDFDPAWVFGNNLAAETLGADVSHLENPNTTMAIPLPWDTRRLPSHTDLFSMASALGFEHLDVPRREFYGNTNWQNDSNWSGDTEPNSNDEVFVRAAQGSGTALTARLTANGFAGALHVSEGANVDVDGFKLDVTGDVDVSDPDSDIFIDQFGELEAREVRILNQAEIEFSNGLLDVQRLTVHGQLEAVAGVAVVDVAELLVNSGVIVANGNSTMNFLSSAANPWDLRGEVRATGGDIYFMSGGLTDDFNGTMTIGGGHTLSIPEAWSLASLTTPLGTLQFNGDGVLAGGDVSMSGTLNVANGTAQIEPAMFMNRGSVLVANSGVLQLDGEFGHFGGAIEVEAGGSIVVNDSVTVTAGTTSTIDGQMIFNASAELRGGTIQGSGKHVYNATATIHQLANVNIGSMEVGAGGNVMISDNITVSVADETLVGAGGSVEITDATVNAAMLTANAGSFVMLHSGRLNVADFEKAADATLNLEGGNFTISGGDAAFNSSFAFGGAGDPIVRIEDGADAVVTFAWRMATSASESATTIVTGTGGGRRSTLRGTGGGGGADLVVGLSGDAALLVDGGALADFRDDFTIGQNAGSVGQATVVGVQGDFRSTVNVTGSGVGSSVQIGGGDGGGAAAGILRIQAGAFVGASGNVIMARYPGVDSVAHLEIGGMAGGFPAELNVAEDVFVGGTTTTAGGEATVTLSAGGLLRADEMIVWGDGTVNMHGGEMFLDTLDLGAGGGEFNLRGGVLHVDRVDGSLTNDGGTISPGGSPGLTEIIGDYRHNENARLLIELAGLVPEKEHDVLSVTGGVTLDGGALDVALDGGFTPAAGDDFDILNFGSLRGEFDLITLPLLASTLTWDASQLYNTGVLSVVNAQKSADFDDDGDVDGDDLGAWTKSFSKADLADADADGDSDGADFLAWQQQVGSGAPAMSAASAVPEPSGAVFALVAFAGAILSARRRDRPSSSSPRLRPPKMRGVTGKFDE